MTATTTESCGSCKNWLPGYEPTESQLARSGVALPVVPMGSWGWCRANVDPTKLLGWKGHTRKGETGRETHAENWCDTFEGK